MKMNGILGPACVGVLSVVFTISFAHASLEGDKSESSSGNVEETRSDRHEAAKTARLAKLLKEASFSPGVADVARLASAGASTAILIAHVQASDTPYKLRPEDITHLEENSVPDSVIASMIVRGAEVRAKTASAPQPAQPVQASSPSPAATVVYVSAPNYRLRRPVSTVTFIGGSHPCWGSRYGSHSYGTRSTTRVGMAAFTLPTAATPTTAHRIATVHRTAVAMGFACVADCCGEGRVKLTTASISGVV